MDLWLIMSLVRFWVSIYLLSPSTKTLAKSWSCANKRQNMLRFKRRRPISNNSSDSRCYCFNNFSAVKSVLSAACSVHQHLIWPSRTANADKSATRIDDAGATKEVDRTDSGFEERRRISRAEMEQKLVETCDLAEWLVLNRAMYTPPLSDKYTAVDSRKPQVY